MHNQVHIDGIMETPIKPYVYYNIKNNISSTNHYGKICSSQREIVGFET